MGWPFKLTLQGLLLEGKDREKAKAKYELQGEELERKLLDLDYDNTSIEYKRKSLFLDFKYAKLTQKQYDAKFIQLTFPDENSVEYKKAALELRLENGEISELDYAKELATLNNEPWVVYKDYGIEEVEGKTGFWFEFDWNSVFIEKLVSEGYEGATEEQIVKRWYAELCRVVAIEEGMALDLFGDGSDDETTQLKSIKRRDIDDSFSEYS
jgi:hypothetical protein